MSTSVPLHNSASQAVQNALQQILALPLPAHQSHQFGDSRETAEMDFWTAASLNTENIQEYNFEDEINAKNAAGWTPLMYAAYLGHRELCQLMVLRGADVEAANGQAQTAIMLAASCGAIDVVRILLDFSADCNRQDQYGRSSLHYAVKYYHAPVVQLLLEKGADPNLPDFNDSTPLLAACENGEEKILAYVLEQKGDPHRCNKQGQNAFNINTDQKVQAVLKKYRQETEVDKVLAQLELEKYGRNFAIRGIRTVEALVKLTERDLDEMGINLVGPKRKITNFIRERANPQQQQQQPRVAPNPAAPRTQQPPARLVDQQRVSELAKLCADQRQEMQEQRRANAQCRLVLSQILNNGRCTACSTRTPLRGTIEELIRELDRMNARMGSFLI